MWRSCGSNSRVAFYRIIDGESFLWWGNWKCGNVFTAPLFHIQTQITIENRHIKNLMNILCPLSTFSSRNYTQQYIDFRWIINFSLLNAFHSPMIQYIRFNTQKSVCSGLDCIHFTFTLFWWKWMGVGKSYFRANSFSKFVWKSWKAKRFGKIRRYEAL